ncbi:uncharacterized protein G2W53_017116 [Senna tora]|uniref:Uncharacterized protein n=1 Tax=Senna tora TaxID=362788 RepID=A0A834WK62_9FABA|nr:uncharacterized protein G2W53_017116 [Senna tora]
MVLGGNKSCEEQNAEKAKLIAAFVKAIMVVEIILKVDGFQAKRNGGKRLIGDSAAENRDKSG